MYIKPCPVCGRLPKVTQGSFNHKGRKPVFFVGCPNMCFVLKPQYKEDKWKYGVSWLRAEGFHDYNDMFRMWNDNLIEKTL